MTAKPRLLRLYQRWSLSSDLFTFGLLVQHHEERLSPIAIDVRTGAMYFLKHWC